MRNKYVFRSALVILLLFLVLLHLQFSLALDKVSIQKILSNPDKYDRQEVTIQGKASKVQPKTSKKGNEYTTFALIDESGKEMNIFTWGHPKIMDGQKVTVIGIYQKVKKVGRYTFHNEVEAKDIK